MADSEQPGVASSIASLVLEPKALTSRKVIPGRVSVIIAVYQGEALIEGAVRSALAQTYVDLEVLVVDDGSTDKTVARLAEISDPRLTVLRQSNQGAASARNLALTEARGEYIACLDADDRWFPEKLEIEVRTLRSAADPVGIAYSWYYAVDNNGKLLNRSRAYDYAGNVFNIMIREDFDIVGSIALFHHRIFEQIGNFDADRRLHEDGVFMFRATKTFPVYPTRRYLVVYRQTTEGKCRRALTDFETARNAALSFVDDLRPVLSDNEADCLRDRQIRSLYFRFLMYGYGKSAKRMLPDVDSRSLKHGVKGWIGWFHAKSGINLMRPLRLIVQRANIIVSQRTWQKELSRRGLDLRYAAQTSEG